MAKYAVLLMVLLSWHDTAFGSGRECGSAGTAVLPGGEIIVILRSAGTGSYLSADAVQYRDGILKVLARVRGLARSEDPVGALERAVKVDPGPSPGVEKQ